MAFVPRLRLGALPLVAALLAFAQAPAAGQEVPPAPDLLAWMGLAAGDTMAFQAPGGTMCVTVGPPRTIDGRSVAPLFGLSWPGFASDSRIYVPLDGTLDLLVDRTPGPRPSVESFLDPDGWRWSGSDWHAADSIVHSTCAGCMDAGSRLVLEKGGGIAAIRELSFFRSTFLTRVDGGCTEREGIEFEIYVEPAPAREP